MASTETVEASVDGTQAIRRAAAILRCIGRGDARGVGLAAIAETLRLPRSTTHRIIKCLVDEGLVKHEQKQRSYVIGRLTYELGQVVTNDLLEVARWRGAVDNVARRTGVTSYLMSRSGIEATCVLKTDGNSVIRVIPVDIGQRRFLGVGAGSTALLAALDPDTSERVIETITPYLRGYPGLTADVVRRLVTETRETGFTLSRSNVVENVIGIGMAIPQESGAPSLALSIAALASHASEEAIDKWKEVIREEVEAVLAEA